MILRRRNVNELFPDALYFIRAECVVEESRNGPVKTIPFPVQLTSLKPQERVLFCKLRNENPYFHFLECLWMMAGRQDAAWISQYNPRMEEFAEPNGNFHGAYGHRWRKHFGFDQLLAVVKLLKEDPSSRQAVLSMWDAYVDLGVKVKDLPCNTHCYFRVRGKDLDMTVCNRSNDLVWGALGSNVVHFSFLLELVAHAIGKEVGVMHQFTNNLHVYERHWKFVDEPPHCLSYASLVVRPYPIISTPLESWLEECESLVNGGHGPFRDPFFSDVALPILTNRWEYCRATDWRLACSRYSEKQ